MDSSTILLLSSQDCGKFTDLPPLLQAFIIIVLGMVLVGVIHTECVMRKYK